jgi:uncharacterized sulfatase
LKIISLRRSLDNSRAKWDKATYTQTPRGGQGRLFMEHSARAERWRYIEWDEGRQDVKLYDHNKDPRDYRNLANDSAYSKTIGDLQPLLRAAPKAPVSEGHNK